VEDAQGLDLPGPADLVRNLMFCAQFLQDHVVRFYHLHARDWLDLTNLVQADPAAAALLAQARSPWPKAGADHFAAVQQGLRPYSEGVPSGLFAEGYPGHPAHRPSPEESLVVVAHYLDTLAWNQDILRIHALFGGHRHHPAYRVGGLSQAVDAATLAQAAEVIRGARAFVDEVYVPDLLALAGHYRDWAGFGGGLGNFLAYGDLPTRGYHDPASFRLPRGAILGRDLATVHPVELGDLDVDGHPATPRWRGRPMEVGPLARVLVAYARDGEVRDLTDAALGHLGLPFPALFSTLGRVLARGVEAQALVRWMGGFLDDLGPSPALDPPPGAGTEGLGLTEAPRGALAHRVRLDGGMIASYQMVLPSTWNAAPRDVKGVRSALEAALAGTPVADPARPVELLRAIHAFDPCVPCDLQVRGANGRTLHAVLFN
jgi:hydrogenase large subunit